jgi:hypothetical protein
MKVIQGAGMICPGGQIPGKRATRDLICERRRRCDKYVCCGVHGSAWCEPNCQKGGVGDVIRAARAGTTWMLEGMRAIPDGVGLTVLEEDLGVRQAPPLDPARRGAGRGLQGEQEDQDYIQGIEEAIRLLGMPNHGLENHCVGRDPTMIVTGRRPTMRSSMSMPQIPVDDTKSCCDEGLAMTAIIEI